MHTTESYTPNQNFVETMISWLKKKSKSQMRQFNMPSLLWDYSMIYE